MSRPHYLRRRLNSFRYAANGVRTIVATQDHARIHIVASLCVVSLAWALNVSAAEWCMLVLAIALVWLAEALNTALEFAVDLASPEIHPLAAKAKDAAAGGVLLAACLAAVVGAIVFLPKLLP